MRRTPALIESKIKSSGKNHIAALSLAGKKKQSAELTGHGREITMFIKLSLNPHSAGSNI